MGLMARPLLALAMLLLIAAAPIKPTKLTPGAINKAISPANMSRTICNPRWSTKSIRPPASFTTRLKAQQLRSPLYVDKRLSSYEEDHLISLEIGGAPRDPKNLWPEPYAGSCGARIKDRLENRLHKLICAKSLTLHQAQREITGDWVASYRKHVGPLNCN